MDNAGVCSVFLARCLIVWLAAAACVQAQSADAQRTFGEGEKALQEGRYEAAEQAYEKLARLDPTSPDVNARLGMIYFDDHKYAQAVPALRQSLKLKPAQAKLGPFLAISLSELGQYQEALPGLDKAVHSATDAALRRLAGLQLERAYTGLHRDGEAVQVALELNKLYPNDPEVLFHGARVFGNMAYLSFARLAEVAPDSSWKHQASAEAFESQGSLDLAAAEYGAVLKTNPNRPGVHFRLGRVLLARAGQADAPAGAAENATKEFAAELALDPSNANAAYELAEMARKGGQLDKAAELFQTAVGHFPDFEEAQVGLGRVLVAQGKPAEALPHLEKAVAVNPRDAVAYYQLSQAEKGLGDEAGQKKALAEFRKLREQATSPDLSKEITPQPLEQGAAVSPRQ